jgi:acyl-CoA synthetase (AMP-forming)/AMP-acid ligase II
VNRVGQAARFFAQLEQFGERPALWTDTGRTVSYADLATAADLHAKELGAPGLVFLEARNRADFIAAYLGCLRGGHTVYLFSAQDSASLDALVERYQPHAVVHCEPDGLDIVRRNAPDIVLAPDLRLLMSTSGSTGSAKFVKLSGRNLDENAKSIAQYLELDQASRAITSLKPHYSYGLSIINSHLAVGGSLALTELSVIDAGFWDTFSASGADSLAGVPYTYELLDRQGIRLSQVAGLRYATQAGGRLSASLVQTFARDARDSGRRFYVMYGQTEASPRMAYLPPEMAVEWPDSIGVPIPGGRFELFDDADRVIEGTGQPGQLVYHGPNVMMGYAGQRIELATDDTPAFLLTGDIAVRNQNGLFRIVGRIARFVKPFGVRVNLDEVEQWVNATIGTAACIGTDDRIIAVFDESGAQGVEPLSDPANAARIAAQFKLPPGTVDTRTVERIAKLENGKTDYKALERTYLTAPSTLDTVLPPSLLRLLFSRAFAERVWTEARSILGLSTPKWTGIDEIFKVCLGLTSVDPDASFADLSGDSLSYVQVALGIEAYLGHLPDGWEYMSVADLEEADATASL